MSFVMPKYYHPDFMEERFVNAPDAAITEAEKDGVAPRNYHSTSMYPEYFKIGGQWKLAEESRMDSCVVLRDDGSLAVVEARNLKKGDKVILGRTERCEEGIYLHSDGFVEEQSELEDQFVFRQGRSCTGDERCPCRGVFCRRIGASASCCSRCWICRHFAGTRRCASFVFQKLYPYSAAVL